MNLMRVKTIAPGLRRFRSQRLMAAHIAYRQVPLLPTPEGSLQRTAVEFEPDRLLDHLRSRVRIRVAEETNRKAVFATTDFRINLVLLGKRHTHQLARCTGIQLLLVETTLSRQLARQCAIAGKPQHGLYRVLDDPHVPHPFLKLRVTLGRFSVEPIVQAWNVETAGCAGDR